MIETQYKWVEVLGHFLLDVGKYVLTAVIISSVLTDKMGSWVWLLIATFIALVPIIVGLCLIQSVNSRPKKKK